MNSETNEQHILSQNKRGEHVNTAPMGKDNMNFRPPKKGIWGRVTVLGGINHINSVSDEPCVLEVGTLIVQLFTAENSGTVAIKTQADSLAKHLKAKQLERLELLTPSIINVPSIDGIYQINITVPYRYY